MPLSPDVSRPEFWRSIVVAGAAAAILYALTFSRSVGWHDSAELAVTAHLLGASHAPGSPLHALLGNWVSAWFAEVHIGTTALSVGSAVIATALLAGLLFLLTGMQLVAIAGAIAYAVSFQVWAQAVITELYSLGIACLGASLLAAYFASQRPGWGRLAVVTGFYCAALAAYFGNILLWPVYAWFVWYLSGRRTAALVVFAAGTGLAVGFIGLANLALAANALPFGPLRPDSLSSLVLYMTGSQHEPLQVRTPLTLLGRLLEHTEILLRSTGYVGALLALYGWRYLHRRNAVLSLLFAGVLLVYLGYYTLFGSGDYYLMVVPAYFILYIWMGCGVAALLSRWPMPVVYYACTGALVLYIGGMLAWQLQGRVAMAHARPAEEFAAVAFQHLPKGAVVLLGYRRLTTLSYMQLVRGERPDLTLLLPARDKRYYLHGEVDDYVTAVKSTPCDIAVYADRELPDWPRSMVAEGPLGEAGWHLLQREQCEAL